MTSRRPVSAAIFVALGASSSALSQTTSDTPAASADDEIIVTGRALPVPLGDEAYDIVTLDRDRLTGSASDRLDEILRSVPGFQLFRRSDARSANPTSQGATLRALGGNASSRALLLLDGVPQTDPFGGWISWPAYDPNRLGQIRVARGGGTGANGPGALAGTIALSSAAPDQLAAFNGDLAYGSRDSFDARLAGAGAIGSTFVSLAGNLARGDGFAPVIASQRGPVDRASPYAQASLAARALVPLAGAELQLSGLAFTDRRERGLDFTRIRTVGGDLSARFVGPRYSALFYRQQRRFENRFASANPVRTLVTPTLDQFAVPSHGTGGAIEVRPVQTDRAELRLGADARRTVGESRELFTFVAGNPTRRREAGGRTLTYGAFVEGSVKPRDTLTLTGGARLDHWTISEGRLRETLLASGASLASTDFDDRNGSRPTARAGIAWRPAGAITLRGAAYLGWRLPTLNELYRPFRLGPDATAANPDLDPERLEGFEAGIDYRPLSAARVGVTLFANRLEGAIANVTLARGPGVFPGVGFVSAAGEFRQRQNLDAVISRGAEFDASLTLRSWALALGYAYSNAKVHASAAALPLDGLRPAQTPRHSGSATLGWSPGNGTRASLSARFVGAQFEDDLNRQRLRDALTLDASASLPLAPWLTLEARAENLADARVEAGVTSDGIVERATPRTLWLGVSLSAPAR